MIYQNGSIFTDGAVQKDEAKQKRFQQRSGACQMDCTHNPKYQTLDVLYK